MHLKALASILHAIWFFLARRILIFSRFPVQIFCDLFPGSRTLLHLFACLSVCLRSSLPGTGIRVPGLFQGTVIFPNKHPGPSRNFGLWGEGALPRFGVFSLLGNKVSVFSLSIFTKGCLLGNMWGGGPSG